MTLIKKTCVLSKQGVKGHVNVVRVADSVGAKIVFDGYFDGLYAVVKIGYEKPIILKLTGAKSEFSIVSDMTGQDEVSCIISDGKTLFAEGGRKGIMHPLDIAKHLEELHLAANPAVTGRTENATETVKSSSATANASMGQPSQNPKTAHSAPASSTLTAAQKNASIQNSANASKRQPPQQRNNANSAQRQQASNVQRQQANSAQRQQANSAQRQQASRPKPPPTPSLSPEVAMQMVGMAMQMNNKPAASVKPYPHAEKEVFHHHDDVEVIDVIPEEIQAEYAENKDYSVSRATETGNSAKSHAVEYNVTEQASSRNTAKQTATKANAQSAATKQTATEVNIQSSATEPMATEVNIQSSATESMATEPTATESMATDFTENADTEYEKATSDGTAKDSAFSQSFLRGLTDKDFYLSIKDKLDELFIIYPRESVLEKLVPSSKWVKINYDADDYYVTGVLSEEDTVSHIVYGVPAVKEVPPPKGMENVCDFLPVEGLGKFSGYYLIFQDINTGEILPGG